MDERNISGVDMAKKLDRTPASISLLINGKRPLTDDLILDILIKVFSFTYDDATAKIGEWRIAEYSEKLGLNMPDGAVPMAENYTYIPLVSEVSCGQGMDMDTIIANGEHEALIPVPNEYVKDDTKTFAFTAKGNSMSNEIQDGDTVIIYQTKDYTPGKVYLYKLGEDYGLARLKREPDNTVTIQKANPQYPPVQVGQRDIEICGVVQVVLNLRVY